MIFFSVLYSCLGLLKVYFYINFGIWGSVTLNPIRVKRGVKCYMKFLIKCMKEFLLQNGMLFCKIHLSSCISP
jgi:hypothetical protein